MCMSVCSFNSSKSDEFKRWMKSKHVKCSTYGVINVTVLCVISPQSVQSQDETFYYNFELPINLRNG